MPTLGSRPFTESDIAWLESLFDCLVDVVFCVKDRAGVYRSVNQAFVERARLRQRADLIGRTCEQVFSKDLADTFTAQDREVWETGEPIRDQLELITNADGSIGWYLASKFPLFDDSGKVIGLIGISQDLHVAHQSDAALDAIRDVVRFIRQHLDTPLRTEALAEQAGLSVEQLDRRMKRIYRLSTKQFVMQSRLDEASRRLAQTDQPLSEIAADCGFSDQSAFTRQFRSATTTTPAEYRRRYRRL